jgi:hypothetical protein
MKALDPVPGAALARTRWALLLGNFVIGCGLQVAAGTLHDLSRTLNVSYAAAGQLISIAAVVVCLGAPLAAWLVRGRDMRKLLALALLWCWMLSALALGVWAGRRVQAGPAERLQPVARQHVRTKGGRLASGSRRLKRSLATRSPDRSLTPAPWSTALQTRSRNERCQRSMSMAGL